MSMAEGWSHQVGGRHTRRIDLAHRARLGRAREIADVNLGGNPAAGPGIVVAIGARVPLGCRPRPGHADAERHALIRVIELELDSDVRDVACVSISARTGALGGPAARMKLVGRK